METPDEGTEIGLEDAYSVNGPDENRRLYARWADSYEDTFVAATRYVYHRRVAEIFCTGLSAPPGAVLDVGCGTGVVGAELRRACVSEIDGIDISAEMLARAAAKTEAGNVVYRRLIEADLTGPIDLATDRYAGIVSAGAFTHGHLGPESLAELLRVAAPGARCAVGINSAHFEELGFRFYLDRFREAGVIGPHELVDTLIYEGVTGANPDDVGHVAVFNVN
jgi:ubiquinone/menaquinone biosynthesis C-methylase UbiE